jgi:hypothetical protein
MGRMKEAMKQTYEKLKRAAKEVGLSFNENKAPLPSPQKIDTTQVQHTYWKGSEDRRHD